jgi:hypothetical protein
LLIGYVSIVLNNLTNDAKELTGVTVVTLMMQLRAVKTSKLLVRQRPNDMVAVNAIKSNTNGRRLTMSPRGQRNSRPAAYPAWATVGIVLALSWLISNEMARMFSNGCE